MAYNSFTDSDKLQLLNEPGVISYRDYGSVAAMTPAIFANGTAYNKVVETADIMFDDVGTVQTEVSNETVEVSVSSGRVLDLNMLDGLMGGLFAVSTTAASPVSGVIFDVASGKWSYDGFIFLPGQNAAGTKQTIASVSGSVDGALVANTDYFQMNLPEVGWGIYVKDSSTVTTLAQTLTITYGYTPAATTVLKTGGVKTISPIEIQFETYNTAGKMVTYTFYKCYTDGNIGHGFTPENGSEPVTMDLKFIAKKDTSRAIGDQLYSVVITQ